MYTVIMLGVVTCLIHTMAIHIIHGYYYTWILYMDINIPWSIMLHVDQRTYRIEQRWKTILFQCLGCRGGEIQNHKDLCMSIRWIKNHGVYGEIMAVWGLLRYKHQQK